MAKDASFDITTSVDLQEADNAVNQASKEIAQRYDFKDAKVATVEFKRGEGVVQVTADSDMRLRAMWDILQSKLIKRGVPAKNLDAGEPVPGGGDTWHRDIKLKQALDGETCKKVVAAIKAQKFKKFSDPNFVQRYGWLYLRFNRDFWYWEIVMMVRKCLIVIIKVVYAKTPKTQAEGSIAILMLFLIPTYYTKPFICYNCLKQHKKRCKHFSANDKLECGILGGSIAMLMFGMLNMDGGGGAGELVFGIIMVIILLSSIAFMARMLYKAQLEQKREERALMRSGNTGTADRNMTGNLSSMMSMRI